MGLEDASSRELFACAYATSSLGKKMFRRCDTM